ncbi:hypothetical protein KsCSTR_23930 [Candidatus Kuenenia stuttgartiensis]|uniref:Uncharacterized protein n=1 Tax=Kuenenia stuttgartiensis TaxID=174633 RepID=Q1Q3T3_KUEST|nr:hypothetical protein KsCSTR_23930 [Candidatus Kuenenia stuttgartiensis]CAJ74666.1 unknown protein [Candidatus Kuenenia stuttgartiensis]
MPKSQNPCSEFICHLSGAFQIFCKNVISRGEGNNSNSSFQLEGKIPQAGCLWYNVQLVNPKIGNAPVQTMSPAGGGAGGGLDFSIDSTTNSGGCHDTKKLCCFYSISNSFSDSIFHPIVDSKP